MEEEEVVVNEESAVPLNSTDSEQEQEPIVSEDVKPQDSDGKDYKSIAENLSKALREERAKNKIETPHQQVVPTPAVSEDDTVRRFLQTEANATIAVKLQTDPSFKDRVELVQDYVAQGYDINMADKLAKADIMDKILAETSTHTPVSIPKTVLPTATPETVRPRLTGNDLDDFMSGKLSVGSDNETALRDVLSRYRPQQ